jgi:3beta-hydroxy-delta5-steroid dehydrogenase/steroid delta-isomerase
LTDSCNKNQFEFASSKLERVSVIFAGMSDASLTTELGRVLVTGGSGFVGANLVTALIDRGHQVRSFERAPSPLSAQPGLEVLQGDICDPGVVAAAVDGIDTVFHTAAIIDLRGSARARRRRGPGSRPMKSRAIDRVTDEYRQRSFAVNVGGTENLVRAAQQAGVKRFIYTASNSVVMGGQRIAGGDETLPYTDRFNDLYTETK